MSELQDLVAAEAMRVMAIDPGEKVGYATVEVKDGKLVKGSMRHGITDLKSFVIRLAKVYESYDVIIMESWRLSAAHARELVGSTLPTVQFIGAVRLLSWLHPKVKLIEQAPSTKKTGHKVMKQVDPKWLDIVEAPGAHDEKHDADALIHLSYWYWREFV